MERADAAACVALLASLVRSEGVAALAGAYGGAGDDSAILRALDILLERPSMGFVWMACEDGVPLGVATVCFGVSTNAGALIARVPDLVVAPEARGRGVGAFVLKSLAEELHGLGVVRLDLGVHDDNPAAKRFYERLGFVANHEQGMSLVFDA